MPHFRYQATDRDNRTKVGQIEADTVTQAVVELEARGLQVQSIGLASRGGQEGIEPEPSPSERTSPQWHAAPEERDRALVRRQVAIMLERGQPLVSPLRCYAAELSDIPLRGRLEALAAALEQRDVDGAVRRFAASPDEWLALLGAVSTATDPIDMLRRFVERYRQTTQLQRQWRRVLIYPAIVVGLAVAVLILIGAIAMPALADFYESYELQLPASTELVLAVSAWLAGGWAFVAIGVLLLIWFAVMRMPTHAVWAAIRRRIPWRRARAIRLAKLANCLADLLEAQLDRADALRVAGLVVDGGFFQPATGELARMCEAGNRVPNAAARQLLSPTVVHAVQAEMQAGSRVRLLRDIGAYRLEEADMPVSFLTSVVSPVAVVLVGIVVGWVVLSLLLPLLNLVHALS